MQDTVNRARTFAEKASKTKTSVNILFIEIPVFISAIFEPLTTPQFNVEAMMAVPKRLDFKCQACGRLDTGWIMHHYQPPYPPEKKICPACKGSDMVEMTYDPNR